MLNNFSSFGFAGRRSGVGVSEASAILAALPAGAVVFATCGRGVSALAAAIPGCSVFGRSPFAALPVRAQFAARAAAFIRALAAAPSPLLLAWPGVVVPCHLSWSCRSWQSCGSGSWSEVALAAGTGVPVVVFGVAQPSPSFVSVVICGVAGWHLSPPRQSNLF